MAQINKSSLTDEERETFNKEWDRFVTMHYPEREYMDIFEDNKEAILEAAEVAKYQLEAPFGGINAKTNQFGWTMIQPNFLLATAAPTYSTSTWAKNYATSDVTTMWADWIGSSASNRTLSKYATMIVLGFYDPVELPKISAIKAHIKGDEYPVWWVDNALRQGLHIFELPKPHIIEREQNLYYQVKVARPGDDELQPLGVYFGRGDHLRSKTAYAQI